MGYKGRSRAQGLRSAATHSRRTFIFQFIYNSELILCQVREKLGLSYSNIRGLHQIVDSIPDRAGAWTSKTLSFPDRPNEKYLIRYRDPLTAIQTLLGNPAHAKDIVYIPKKVFSDSARDNRVYHEMWTGKWWAGVQVS